MECEHINILFILKTVIAGLFGSVVDPKVSKFPWKAKEDLFFSPIEIVLLLCFGRVFVYYNLLIFIEVVVVVEISNYFLYSSQNTVHDMTAFHLFNPL